MVPSVADPRHAVHFPVGLQQKRAVLQQGERVLNGISACFGHLTDPLIVAATGVQFTGAHKQLPVLEVLLREIPVGIGEPIKSSFIRCDFDGAAARLSLVSVTLHFRPSQIPGANQLGAVDDLIPTRIRKLIVRGKVKDQILSVFIAQGRNALTGLEIGTPYCDGAV